MIYHYATEMANNNNNYYYYYPNITKCVNLFINKLCHQIRAITLPTVLIALPANPSHNVAHSADCAASKSVNIFGYQPGIVILIDLSFIKVIIEFHSKLLIEKWRSFLMLMHRGLLNKHPPPPPQKIDIIARNFFLTTIFISINKFAYLIKLLPPIKSINTELVFQPASSCGLIHQHWHLRSRPSPAAKEQPLTVVYSAESSPLLLYNGRHGEHLQLKSSPLLWSTAQLVAGMVSTWELWWARGRKGEHMAVQWSTFCKTIYRINKQRLGDIYFLLTNKLNFMNL